MPRTSTAARSINPVLLASLGLAFAYHGALLLSGSYKRTYDAYVHIFFADHYARAWFDNWDDRWYTGFTVTSYPPGSQQAIALLSKAIGLLDGFVVVQLFAVLLLTIGVYRFSKLWVSEEAAGYAALLTVFSSSLAETVHVFGQLPTTFSLAFLLNALPPMKQWLEGGRWRDLLSALAIFAACTAGHHVTTIFGSIFFAGPVVLSVLLAAANRPLPGEPWGRNAKPVVGFRRQRAIRRLRRITPTLARTALLGGGVLIVLIGVLLPYWLWSASDPINQIPIPHASRDSYIANLNAGLVFWLVPWSVLLIALPYAAYKALTTKIWPLAASLCLATLLGTGGTTPLPKLLLGPTYEILTLDRFTFWATMLILPFAGELMLSLRKRGVANALQLQFGRIAWRTVQVVLAVGVLASSIVVANLTQFRSFQPAAIDMQPIVSFIAKDEHWRWRYLTLGFGDQMAWLSAQTTATTVDGDYHSARRLPELTSTPVERLEDAKFAGVPGLGSLQQFLAVPEKYNLKYVFSNDKFYDPLLFFSGWEQAGRLENGVMVWQRADIPPLPEVLPRKEIPAYQRALWGTAPMMAILAALLALTCSLWGKPVLRLLAFLETARLCRFVPGRRLPAHVWATIDGRLLAWSAIPKSTPGKPVIKRPPKPARSPRFAWLKPPSRRYRWVNSGLAVALAAGLLGGGGRYLLRPSLSPASTVDAYYTDLDFRRFQSAYDRLDPATRPSYDDYLHQLSLRGGLLSSFAKLDSVHASVTHAEPDFALVTANSSWVTALKQVDSTEQMSLVRRHGTWFIQLPKVDTNSPPDTFTTRPDVDFHIQQRPVDPEDPFGFAEVPERPALQLLSARLVVHNGLHSVVGELINVDVTPADVTVTAIVYDAQGKELTRYNAQSVAMHKLLPKETTPFRIDFEGVAGTGTGKSEPAIMFEPGEIFPVADSIWARAASFQVYANGVVTGTDLGREVSASSLAVHDNEGNLSLSGELLNAGTIEAVVPHLLVTYYDADGNVAWVDEDYVDQSILPQRMQFFLMPLATAGTVQTMIADGQLYSNANQHTVALDPNRPDLIPLPASSGYAAIRLSVNTFTEPTT